MGAGFADAMRLVAEPLTAAGLRVFLDASEINPPGVLIQPPAMRYRFRKGDADLEMSLIVIVGNNEPRRAIEQLSELVVHVQEILGERAAQGRPAEVFLAEQTASFAAYELTYTDTLRIDQHQPRGITHA